ncbi:hypothetical protein GCK32_020464 [Trichostrongylus colubriformis]|uniref:Uncharacterized protein n=1 Tax=Trichostrongylus colubriformis TaxID=6319 RepID=A0AAN8INM8_TRICO
MAANTCKEYPIKFDEDEQEAKEITTQQCSGSLKRARAGDDEGGEGGGCKCAEIVLIIIAVICVLSSVYYVWLPIRISHTYDYKCRNSYHNHSWACKQIIVVHADCHDFSHNSSDYFDIFASHVYLCSSYPRRINPSKLSGHYCEYCKCSAFYHRLLLS